MRNPIEVRKGRFFIRVDPVLVMKAVLASTEYRNGLIRKEAD